MTRRVFIFSLFVFALALDAPMADGGNWPRFRGPNGAGIATDKNIPVEWEEENFIFRTEIPGKGHSSPIVFRGKVFLQSSSEDGKERSLIAVDAKTGQIDWVSKVPGGLGKIHAKNSLSSCTPAADDERIYAIFWDGKSLLLTAHHYDGSLAWQQPLGDFRSQHGPGMAPMLVGGTVVVNKDEDGAAELLTYDAKTGKPGWTRKRDHERACYSTPFLLEKTDAGPDLIVVSTGGVTAYDPKDGREIWNYHWKFDKMRLRTVGSPIYHDGIIYAIAGDGGGDRNMIAVRAAGEGDVTSTNLVWQKKKGTAYVPTPLAKDGLLFWIDDKVNVAVCADAKTGEVIWSERLGGGGGVSASPILVDGKIYVASEAGSVFVLAASKEFELLAHNELKEQVFATPAVADGRMYIRGAKHLFCVGPTVDAVGGR